MFTRKLSIHTLPREQIRLASIPSKALLWATVLALLAAPATHAGAKSQSSGGVSNSHQAAGKSRGRGGGVQNDGGRVVGSDF